MQKPNLPDYFMDAIGFARDLITYLGEDPTDIKDNWCWKHLYQRYPQLRPKVEEYLETCETGDVSYAIFHMVKECGSGREWAEKQLETCKYGDVSYAIFRMVKYCGSSRKWAEKQLETCKYGDVSYAIYRMVIQCGSSREWGEKLLEKCKYGNLPYVIYRMVEYCGSSKEWANKVLKEKGFKPLFAKFSEQHNLFIETVINLLKKK